MLVYYLLATHAHSDTPRRLVESLSCVELGDDAQCGCSYDARARHSDEAFGVLLEGLSAYGLEDEEKRKHYYVMESVGIATGFLLAGLHASGLATLTHTPSPMGFLEEILERPENERAYLLIPVGYPAEECEVPDIVRKPYDDFVTES